MSYKEQTQELLKTIQEQRELIKSLLKMLNQQYDTQENKNTNSNRATRILSSGRLPEYK